MKKDITKIIFYICASLLIAAIGFMTGRLIYNVKDVQSVHYCLVKPVVYDAYTGEPIVNATVTNTYDGKTYSTDVSGSTDWIAVYYSDEEELKLCTFIASAEGYKSTILYMVCETKHDPLNGPLLYMFTGNCKDEFVSMVYSPGDDYSKKLKEQYIQNR